MSHTKFKYAGEHKKSDSGNPFWNYIIEILEFKTATNANQEIIQVAKDHQDLLLKEQREGFQKPASRIMENPQRFKERINKYELSDKALNTLIFYVFGSTGSPSQISSKIGKLLSILEIANGSSKIAELNKDLERCCRYWEKDNDKQKHSFSIEIDKDLKIKGGNQSDPPDDNGFGEKVYINTQNVTITSESTSIWTKAIHSISNLNGVQKAGGSVIGVLLILGMFFSMNQTKEAQQEKTANPTTNFTPTKDTILNTNHIEYNGIKNEFNGKVENVNFYNTKEKIEL